MRDACAVLSVECLSWAHTAGYRDTTGDAPSGPALMLSSAAGNSYEIHYRARGRLELIEDGDDVERRSILFARDNDVMEVYLIGLLGDDIREQVDLPFLEMPWGREDLATGYAIGDVVRGYRTLAKVGDGPVAAARGPTLSLLSLVPLSHYLRFSVAELKRVFLSEDGAPLLRNGRYATPR